MTGYISGSLTRNQDEHDRCEPGTGEINYPAIAAALERIGYDGTVGLEAFAASDSELALQRFRQAFAGQQSDQMQQ
jgi:hydroxypyruvate isomerase